jgi:Cu2+-exporting ATPase
VVKFERLPPTHVLHKYDTTDIRDNEVSFLFRNGEEQVSPREIMSGLAEYGPHLPPPGRSREESRINADVRALAIRTAMCALLTIPILVMVWSPVPHKGALGYRAAEFVLATGVFALAFPIYSGSFRTIWYLHQADLGVLTAVSTLTTYIFSIIAFAFQAAGNEIAEPFFETLGLLITLIYLGRTIQASTRKAALSAISSLAKLQPERAVLVTDGKSEDVDARYVNRRIPSLIPDFSSTVTLSGSRLAAFSLPTASFSTVPVISMSRPSLESLSLLSAAQDRMCTRVQP